MSHLPAVELDEQQKMDHHLEELLALGESSPGELSVVS